MADQTETKANDQGAAMLFDGQFEAAVGSSSGSFILEIVTTNDDSDVEDVNDEVQDALSKNTHVLPIYRQASSSDDDDEEDDHASPTTTMWRNGITEPESLSFTGDSGLEVKMSGDSPLDYLHLMIDDTMMENIVVETNRYAAETLRDKQLASQSRFRKWVDVTRGEMWAFFGLIVAMGLIAVDDLMEYWSVDSVFNIPLFPAVMKRDRFCLILSFLHICDNGEQLPNDHPHYDPFFKIRRFISSLQANFQRAFHPGKIIALDDTIVAWKGPLAFSVYDPQKPEKVGMRLSKLCDGETGYCSNIEFYAGGKSCSPFGPKFDVVTRLTTPYLGCGRTLFLDDCYTSPDLFNYLKDNGTLACGALGRNRRNGPPKSMVPKLCKRNPTTSTLTNGSLNLICLFERCQVNILTTAHDNALVPMNKTNSTSGEVNRKLQVVTEYNKFLGAIRKDHTVFNTFKRRTMKWWKKAFFHLYMLGILNAYIVHKASASKKLTHRIFRRELVKQLVQWAPIPPCPSLKVVELGDTSLLRLSARHFPGVVQSKPGTKHPVRVCVVCPGKCTTRYECPSCNVGLHVVPCFKKYHTERDCKRITKRKLDEV